MKSVTDIFCKTNKPLVNFVSLSALDVPVAIHVYKKCINGLLKRKTRIVCTHHPRFLKSANEILVLEDGKIKDVGSPNSLLPKLSHQFHEDSSTDLQRQHSRFVLHSVQI